MTAVSVVEMDRAPLPVELAATLRALADRIESGEVISCVCAIETAGEFEYYHPGRQHDNLRLADLLHYSCLRSFTG